MGSTVYFPTLSHSFRRSTFGSSILDAERTSFWGPPGASGSASTSPSKGALVPRLRFLPVRLGTVILRTTLWVRALCEVSGLAVGLSGRRYSGTDIWGLSESRI